MISISTEKNLQNSCVYSHTWLKFTEGVEQGRCADIKEQTANLKIENMDEKIIKRRLTKQHYTKQRDELNKIPESYRPNCLQAGSDSAVQTNEHSAGFLLL